VASFLQIFQPKYCIFRTNVKELGGNRNDLKISETSQVYVIQIYPGIMPTPQNTIYKQAYRKKLRGHLCCGMNINYKCLKTKWSGKHLELN